MTSPTHHAATEEVAGWFNYEFQTDLDCPNKCGPGAHPLYIGKSNDSLRRLLEHAKTQPWFKYVTGWKIHPERYATEQESLAAEGQRIRARRPLANKAGNEDNPCRIDFGAHAPQRRPTARRAATRITTRRVIPLSRRPVRADVVAGVVGVAGVVALFWWAACHFLAVAVLAGLVAAVAAVVAMAVAGWALSLRKRSPWRPVLLWTAAGVAGVAVWALAGMPDPPTTPAVTVPAVSR